MPMHGYTYVYICIYTYTYIYHLFFIHSSDDGYLDWFQILAIVKSAANKCGDAGIW